MAHPGRAKYSVDLLMNSDIVSKLWPISSDSRDGKRAFLAVDDVGLSAIGMMMEQIPSCVRCGSVVLWRDRNNAVRCATCEPARAAWLIRERLRANTTDTQLRRAMRLILKQFEGRTGVAALVVVDAAEKAGISVATLTRARTLLRVRSEKHREGWWWIQRPPQ
jgi:hypothetical protein